MKAAAPGNPEVQEGYFALPQGPGLGVKLDEEVIREHPQQKIFFNLFAENWHRCQAKAFYGLMMEVLHTLTKTYVANLQSHFLRHLHSF